MCYSPRTIKNPFHNITKTVINFNNKDPSSTNVYKVGNALNYLRNTHEAYIKVPCGECSQCTSMRQSFYNQRVQIESLRSYLFKITLTYNKNVCYTDIGSYHVMYPEYKDIQNMFKMMRKDGHSFRYWIVSEYGSGSKPGKRSKYRPHYHGIIAIDKSLFPGVDPSVIEQTYHALFLSYWRRNVGSRRNPVWVPLLDYVVRGRKRTYDFGLIQALPGHDNDLSFYISKYILKYDKRTRKLLQKIKLDPSLDDNQTHDLISKIKPRSIMSKDFGDWKLPEAKSHIDKCLRYSRDIPQFFDLNTGQSMMLSRYYQKHLVPIEYWMSVHERLSTLTYSKLIPSDDSNLDTIHDSINADRLHRKFLKAKSLLSDKYC